MQRSFQYVLQSTAFQLYTYMNLLLILVSQGLSSEDMLMQLYLLVLSNLEGWVDVSQSLCTKLVQGGMLLQNINDVQYLGGLAIDKSEVGNMHGGSSSR